MHWLAYVFLTIASWGLYGVFLHSGQIAMKDPVFGRYKAFLFVGVAYFIFAVLAPLALLKLQGSDLISPARACGSRCLRASSGPWAPSAFCWPSGPRACRRW